MQLSIQRITVESAGKKLESASIQDGEDGEQMTTNEESEKVVGGRTLYLLETSGFDTFVFTNLREAKAAQLEFYVDNPPKEYDSSVIFADIVKVYIPQTSKFYMMSKEELESHGTEIEDEILEDNLESELLDS